MNCYYYFTEYRSDRKWNSRIYIFSRQTARDRTPKACSPEVLLFSCFLDLQTA